MRAGCRGSIWGVACYTLMGKVLGSPLRSFITSPEHYGVDMCIRRPFLWESAPGGAGQVLRVAARLVTPQLTLSRESKSF